MDDNLVGNNAAHIVRAKELFWAMISGDTRYPGTPY